jgi:hypothetical protein
MLSDDRINESGSEYPSPERVVNFVRRVIRGEKFYAGPERRANLRYPITMPVRVAPLTDALQPCGQAFLAVTRDISVGGLCFYHTQPIKQRFLQVEMTSPTREQLTVVLEVKRLRQAGPFYEVAGNFSAQDQ